MFESKPTDDVHLVERYRYDPKAGIGLVLLAAIFIALTPSMAKLAYQADANTLAVVTCRCVSAALGIGAYMMVTGRKLAFVFRDYPLGPLTGTAQAFGSLGLLLAVAYIDAGLAFLIVFFHPFLVAIVEHNRGNTELRPIHVILIGCALSGLALAVTAGLGVSNYFGVGAAVLGAIATTVMVVSMSDASKKTNVLSASFSMMFWASIYYVAASVIGPPLGFLDAMIWPNTTTGWLGMAGTGLSFTIGYLLFFAGAKTIGITRASVLSIIEPVLALVFAMILLGEWITLFQWFGVALVVGSLLVFERLQTK
ncbi:MAG: DMT family transporter [Pseudomonadota bacterium]